MYVGANSGVNAYTADINAVASVAVYKIYGVYTALGQCFQISVKLAFLAEHAAEIIACAGGEGGNSYIIQHCTAADTFVECSIAAAGVNMKLVVKLSILLNFTCCIQRCLRDINFILIGAAF